MCMSMILAMVGSGALFGMQVNDCDNQWMVLSVDTRKNFYQDMDMRKLCNFSRVSKDIYEDVYYYKRMRFLEKVKKSEYGSLGSSHPLGNPRALEPLYHDGSLHNLARVKQNIKGYKYRFGIIKQPWMIEQKEAVRAQNRKIMMIKGRE